MPVADTFESALEGTSMNHDPSALLSGLPLGSISVRVFWPYARVLGNYDQELAILRGAGIDEMTFADPMARIPKAIGRQLVAVSIARSGDASLGLHAGECVELADFAPIDQMTRHCQTLRDAILCAARYGALQDEGVRSELVESSARATVLIHNLDPHRHAVVNEFQMASTIKRLGFFLHRDLDVLEVHLRNPMATSAAEYARVFRAPVHLGAECNAVVFPSTLLDARAMHANPKLHTLFDVQAQRLLGRIALGTSFTQKVRDLLERGLEDGRVGMSEVAKRLSLSEATLRRRLSEEQTTHKELLDRIRRDRALSHVEERHATLGEIGFRLGFSSPSAFGRAFRRWVGISPVEYRSRLRAQ
jgi:AraC-like DNA-binding protein